MTIVEIELEKGLEIPRALNKELNPQHHQHCCGNDRSKKERGLDPEWIEANCRSVNIGEATALLGYPSRSGGIAIEGANGQFQLRPDRPWSNKPGQKAPKYRTARGDEYTALLPKHPTDKTYWLDIEALKQRCYSINGHPMLVVTEGGFKAIRRSLPAKLIALCSHGIPTIALLGVEMGLTPASDDPQGKRYLVPELERFARVGFGFILGFDADTYDKKPVKQALIKLARQLQKFRIPVYTLPKWDENDGKGLDDYIQNKGIEAFREELLSQAISFDEWSDEYGADAFEKKANKPPKPDIIGAEIGSRYRNTWIYCDELRTWLAYGLEKEGIWEIVSTKYLAAEVHAILKARNIQGYGTNAYINNIIGALERELYLRKWKEKSSTEWLPFQNGVLELATGKLHPHSPGFRFTWQLPRDYVIVESGWRSIDNWLTEATQGNQEYKELLICFAAGVLRGRNDLQKFLHLIGGGGSGKSTFTTLLTALIGEENTATLNLSDLEDKHEIARIFGKRLVVLPDQDKAAKKMSNFKRLTGQDRLSGRRLFENGFEFIFGGLTVVTSNFPIFHTNVGSWLTRRVKMIPFNYQCPAHKKRDLMKEFEPELGAFTSYLLSIPEKEIENVLNGLGKEGLSSTVWEAQMRSDGMAAWVNDHLIQDCLASTKIGSNSKEWRDEEYDATLSTLYGSYVLYCQQTNRSAKSPQNFSAELLELTTRILGWKAEKGKVKPGSTSVRVIKGLRLRTPLDDQPTVEEMLEGDRGGDKQGDNQGDNLESPPNKKVDRGDNSYQINKEEKNNLSSISDKREGNTIEEEIKQNTVAHNVVKTAEVVVKENTQITPAVPKQINWQSYPYNSSSEKKLQERAGKVVEKILSCSTSNELIELKISEREITWLKENVLTTAEREQVKEIESTRQGNLFAQNEVQGEELIELDWAEVIIGIDREMKRIGWSVDEGKNYLKSKYGVKSRRGLTNTQIIEFWNYLKRV